jgi:hypothetical protein
VNLHLPPREPARATRVASIDGPARYQWTVGDAERCREGTGKLRPNAVTAGSMRNSSNDHRLIDAVSLLIAPSSARSTNFQQ